MSTQRFSLFPQAERLWKDFLEQTRDKEVTIEISFVLAFGNCIRSRRKSPAVHFVGPIKARPLPSSSKTLTAVAQSLHFAS